MKKSLVLLYLLFCVVGGLTQAQAAQGKFTGGSAHSMPEWFKQSFMDINEDVEEATEENKHLMMFMTLKFCPYCTKMLNDSFVTGAKLQPYIQKNFDVVGVDIRGNKEVTLPDDTALTEMEYAKHLNIQITPTILIFDENGKIVVKVNGYRSAENFKNILDFAKNKEYKKMTLTEYLAKVKNKTLYNLQENKTFKKLTNLSTIDGPLAVLFEDGSCTQCDYLHNTTLKNKDVIKEMAKYTVVRYNADSTEKIITPNGKETTPKAWANELLLDYRPGILLFNDKKEQARVDSLLYSFHFKELFRYVSAKEYTHYKSYLEYLKPRQKELLEKGIDIDISDK